MKAYCLLSDTPQGICIGFRPSEESLEEVGFEVNQVVEVAEDSGGDYYKYNENGDVVVVDEYDYECEPDDTYIFRSEQEWEDFVDDYVNG